MISLILTPKKTVRFAYLFNIINKMNVDSCFVGCVSSYYTFSKMWDNMINTLNQVQTSLYMHKRFLNEDNQLNWTKKNEHLYTIQTRAEVVVTLKDFEIIFFTTFYFILRIFFLFKKIFMKALNYNFRDKKGLYNWIINILKSNQKIWSGFSIHRQFIFSFRWQCYGPV